MAAKTVMTIDDIRAQLRRVSAEAAELSLTQRRGSRPVLLRDALIRVGLHYGVRPMFLAKDSSLGRQRINQIKNAGRSIEEDIEYVRLPI